MATYVRISAIGPRPLSGRPAPDQDAVREMIAFWRGRLDQVLPDQPDLIVLPEACDCYPSHSLEERRRYYRVRGDQVRGALAEVARKHRCYIAYSAAREMADGSWRNSTQLLDRQGEVLGIYDKNHLVVTEIEAGFLCGSAAPVMACDFGRVGCAICFDLNFDELRSQYAAAQPDLILFSSMYHGGLMQPYWAYTCRAHLVGAIAGPPSAILSPVGHTIASSTNYLDYCTATVNLDCRVVHLDFNWEKLRAMKAKYGRGVSIHDPGYLGAVLIASQSQDVSCAELVQEFEIELLDDYWRRSLAAQHDAAHRAPAAGS
ncbi:MAG: carbon-nitrogen hydrolase family protein [Anaerolineae bacterium]|nr:carbon-nitrogen hydrolase family protein [Anaerolineae bacterium]